MRIRKKRNRDVRVEKCRKLMIDCDESEINELIKNIKSKYGSIEMEIGCGKGQFIYKKAIENHCVFYIGIEKQIDALIPAMERILEAEIENVAFMNADAEKLAEFFPEGSVKTIYLNFSDPWPKSRHDKRRLTYSSFLKVYQRILIKGGKLIFKTDNDGLFEFSIEELKKNGWDIVNLVRDLHNSEFTKENITTEYEDYFSSKGIKIKMLVAIPPVSD